MSLIRRSLLAGGAAVAALVLAGCGNGSAGNGEVLGADKANPCAAKSLNPCAAKALNPCAAKALANPCAAKAAAAGNPCNPCAAKNPCNPCAAKNPCNPCGGANPCNPCGGASVKKEQFLQSGRAISGKADVALGEKLWNDRMLGKSGLACANCHVEKYGQMNATFAKPYPHRVAMPYMQGGADQVSAAEMVQFCMLVPMATEPLDWSSDELASLAAYVESIQGGYKPVAAAASNPCNPCGARNPCNPCGAKNPCNPCAAKNPCNPCAAKNPCNPCAAKNPCNPCGSKNPCNPCGAKNPCGG